MPETTPLIKAALNLRVGAGFDVYVYIEFVGLKKYREHKNDSFWIFVYGVDISVNVVYSQYHLDKAQTKGL